MSSPNDSSKLDETDALRINPFIGSRIARDFQVGKSLTCDFVKSELDLGCQIRGSSSSESSTKGCSSENFYEVKYLNRRRMLSVKQ